MPFKSSEATFPDLFYFVVCGFVRIWMIFSVAGQPPPLHGAETPAAQSVQSLTADHVGGDSRPAGSFE